MVVMKRLLVSAALMAAIAALPGQAQRRGGGAPAMRSFGARGFAPGHVAVSPGVAFAHNPRVHGFFVSPFFPGGPFVFRRGFVHRRVLFAAPFFWPGPLDYGYSSYPTTVEPDQYVESDDDRGLGSEIRDLREQVGQLRADLAERAAEPSRPPETAAPPQKESPATELVFRDGHRVEARNYIIVGPTIWVLTEQQAKKISIEELDLDATRKANNERGLDFRLPATGTNK